MGVCDAPEFCTGTSDICPSDRAYPNGHVCRDGTDLCDAPEVCDGMSHTCPADLLHPEGHVCRTATDLCDADDTCDGMSDACPDMYQGSDFVCRAAADVCVNVPRDATSYDPAVPL